MKPNCLKTAVVTPQFLGSVRELDQADRRDVVNALILFMANPAEAGLCREPVGGGTDELQCIRAGDSCRVLLSGGMNPKLLLAGNRDVLHRYAEHARAEATAFAEAPIAFQLRVDFWQGEPLAGFETPSCGAPVSPDDLSRLILDGGVYLPLAHLLVSRGSEVGSVALSFREMETALGKALPESARADAAWWANDCTHAQANAWVAIGWNAAAVDLQKGIIVFTRNAGDRIS